MMHDKPLAANGLKSYRYKGLYGYIMIGAKNDDDAFNEASRSSSIPVTIDKLEKWNGNRYEQVLSK